ncbi:MAG: hypothetical protein KJZ93_21175 [Caldilineaceae bacterium]|nr:hypothetical protein [Caldilineaceae bacterium]
MSNSITYQIRIKDHLGEEWTEWFAPLVIHNEPTGTATLTGPVRDQAELMGFLTKIHNLNLELLAVQRIAAGTACGQG